MKLYVIHEPETGYTKIGISTNPRDRLNHLQTANPRPLLMPYVIDCEDAPAAEKTLHAIFNKCRIAGEWFDVSPQDVFDQAVTSGIVRAVQSSPLPAVHLPGRDWASLFFMAWALFLWLHGVLMVGYVLLTGSPLTGVEATALILYLLAGAIALFSSNGHGRTDN